MDYLPLFAELKQRPVLVIGGDEIAERKIKFLLRAQAQVQVVAGTLSPALADLAARQALSWRATEFSDSLVDDVFLVIAATEDEALNQRVFAAANARYRLVNVVDNRALCSFLPFYRRPFAAAGGDLLQRQSAGAVAYSAREN
nr:bifunctional precorrin-2 dehydrogenase/sirohydrochlorin ferrochelatase [Klebsiella variicola]